MSSVTGFEQNASDFIDYALSIGIQISNTENCFNTLA